MAQNHIKSYNCWMIDYENVSKAFEWIIFHYIWLFVRVFRENSVLSSDEISFGKAYELSNR